MSSKYKMNPDNQNPSGHGLKFSDPEEVLEREVTNILGSCNDYICPGPDKIKQNKFEHNIESDSNFALEKIANDMRNVLEGVKKNLKDFKLQDSYSDVVPTLENMIKGHMVRYENIVQTQEDNDDDVEIYIQVADPVPVKPEIKKKPTSVNKQQSKIDSFIKKNEKISDNSKQFNGNNQPGNNNKSGNNNSTASNSINTTVSKINIPDNNRTSNNNSTANNFIDKPDITNSKPNNNGNKANNNNNKNNIKNNASNKSGDGKAKPVSTKNQQSNLQAGNKINKSATLNILPSPLIKNNSPKSSASNKITVLSPIRNPQKCFRAKTNIAETCSAIKKVSVDTHHSRSSSPASMGDRESLSRTKTSSEIRGANSHSGKSNRNPSPPSSSSSSKRHSSSILTCNKPATDLIQNFSSGSTFKAFTPKLVAHIQNKRLSISPGQIDRNVYNPLSQYKEEVDAAIHSKKTFTVKGSFNAIRRALLRREWIEKIPISYRDLSGTETRNLAHKPIVELLDLVRQKHQSSDLCKRLIRSKLLISHQVDLYWGFNHDGYKECSDKIKLTLINKVRWTSSAYTSKQALSASSKKAIWFHIPGIANLNHPRSYRLVKDGDAEEFVKDFNLTAAMSLLKWIKMVNDTQQCRIMSTSGKVPVKIFDFAINECYKFIKKANHEDIDHEIKESMSPEWNEFLDYFYKTVHIGNHFKQESGMTERPMLIYNTKFDIRQWFLISCCCPLTIWIYKQCYLRFSSQTYNLRKLHESIHLTNNSVQCKYESQTRDLNLPRFNMWDSVQFKNYLSDIGYPAVYNNVIYPGMKESITAAVLMHYENMDTRKNSFELYGADFILTEDFKPWLLEINANPALYASTPITARMCPKVLEDVIKVVVDYARDKRSGTGGFELLYKGIEANCRQNNLSIAGKHMKIQEGDDIRNESNFVKKKTPIKDESQTSEFGFGIKKTLEDLLQLIQKERERREAKLLTSIATSSKLDGEMQTNDAEISVPLATPEMMEVEI